MWALLISSPDNAYKFAPETLGSWNPRVLLVAFGYFWLNHPKTVISYQRRPQLLGGWRGNLFPNLGDM